MTAVGKGDVEAAPPKEFPYNVSQEELLAMNEVTQSKRKALEM